MFNYIKFNLFLKSSFQEVAWWTWIEQKKDNKEKSNLPPKIQERVDQLRKEFELLKLNKKFVWWAEERLRAQLLEIGDPKDKEYLEIVEKIKRMQSELKRLWEDSQRVIQELSKLLWEVRVEIKKISPEEISQLKGIDNKKFLEIPEEKRLKYITKDAVDSAEVANWNVKNLEFTFTFDWQFNRELYLKTTAWQVLPKEVWEIKVWWEIYSRNNIKWEFFTPDNKRLKIHEWTKIEILNLRTPKDLEKLAWNNQNQITENWYIKAMIEKTARDLWVSPKIIQSILDQESDWNMSATRFEKRVYIRELRKWNSKNDATLLATSFWWFQIMWFNYKVCWYNSVSEFADAMKTLENQFNAFANFVKSIPALHNAMKWNNPNFSRIAYYYNWPNHHRNNYSNEIKRIFYT